jgi:XTP/dITP diphosphohydrolase
VLCDDSGIEIDALGGAPGVYSARYYGPELTMNERIARLLEELEGEDNRQARMVCWLILLSADGRERIVSGIQMGQITRLPRGEHGFGYDPIFELDGVGQTLAQLRNGELHRLGILTHRGLALRRMFGY